MKQITFKQFIRTYNFRYIVENDKERNGADYATRIIRIYYGNSPEEWFEFGVYDYYDYGEYIWENVKEILNPQICNMSVKYFYYDQDTGRFNVHLGGWEK